MGIAPVPRVAVVLVNYRGQADTLECLESLQKLTYPEVDVVLVDQASTDNTAGIVRNRFPHVYVIENGQNNGFAGGNNIGMRAALGRGAPYVFLLNNDTIVDPGLLEPLVARAESSERVGVVGPQMLYYDEPETVWAAGGGAISWRGESVRNGADEPASAHNEAQQLDFVVGCGLLVKSDVLDRVGLFDERYFLYFEETDLCARIRKAGYEIWYEPQGRLWHKVSRTTGADSELTLYYMRRNVLLYLSQHGTRKGLMASLADSLRLAAVWSVQKKTRRRTVLLRAISDFLGGRFGKTAFVFE